MCACWGVKIQEKMERRGWVRGQGYEGEEREREVGVGSTKTMYENMRKPTMFVS